MQACRSIGDAELESPLQDRAVTTSCVNRIVFLPVVDDGSVRCILMRNKGDNLNISFISGTPHEVRDHTTLAVLLRDLLGDEFPEADLGLLDLFVDVASRVEILQPILPWLGVEIMIILVFDKETVMLIDPDEKHILVPNYLLLQAIDHGDYMITMPQSDLDVMWWSETDVVSGLAEVLVRV